MSRISTHVLDTARGLPAAGIAVVLEKLEKREGVAFVEVGRGHTDDDGRLKALLPDGTPLEAATYRITFDVSSYHPDGFFPVVQITFAVRDAGRHHHVPLLLSPYGYSTYRGS